MSFMGTFTSAGYIIIMRFNKNNLHWMQLDFVTSICGICIIFPIVCIIYFIYNAENNLPLIYNLLKFNNFELPTLDPFYLFLCGFSGCAAMITYTIGALKVENSNWIPLIHDIEIPILYFTEYFLLGINSTNYITYIGSTLVLSVVIVLTLQNAMETS